MEDANEDANYVREIVKNNKNEEEELSAWAKGKIKEYEAMGLNVSHLLALWELMRKIKHGKTS